MRRKSTDRARRSIIASCVGWRKDVWTNIFQTLAAASGPPAQLLINSSAEKLIAALRAERGELNQATGRSRGGRATKIHALADHLCRPAAFLLTGGQVADCVAADALLDRMPPTTILNGDKGYNGDAVRRKIESKGAAPNIPPKANRRWKNCFSPVLYRQRNAIERMFGRLKDFRRIATRYDRLAQIFLAAVCLAAIMC